VQKDHGGGEQGLLLISVNISMYFIISNQLNKMLIFSISSDAVYLAEDYAGRPTASLHS